MQALEPRAVTQYVLQKHRLLDGSQAENVLQAVNDTIALHATSAGTPYISLFARVKNFQRNHLDEGFYDKRNLVRIRAMRGTLFITSLESAPMLFQATRLPQQQLMNLTQKWGIQQLEYHKLYEKACDLLKSGGKTLIEIRKALPRELVRTMELREGKSVYKWTNLKWVLTVMMRLGIIVSEKDAGTLRITKANQYVLLREIYPKLNLDSVKSEEARVMLIKHYLKAFGPVTEEDIVWWTGFSKTHVKEALEPIERELRSVKIDGFKEEYLMLEADCKRFAKFQPIKTRSLLLLPYEDPYTKGYKVRDRLVDKEHEKTIYVGGGVQPTILLNGKIAGTWNRNIEEGKGPIELRFLLQPEKSVKREVIQKAKLIGKLMTDGEVRVEVD